MSISRVQIALTTLLWCEVAIGQERRARTRLAWQSPDACANESAVREAVAKLAGRDVFSQEPYDYVVRGSVESPGGSAWVVHLRLETSDGSLVGERELNRAASSCHSLDVPTAVALALMVDLQAVVAEPKRPLPEVSTPTIVYRLPPAPRLAWSVGGALSRLSAVGLFARPSAGARLDVGLRWTRLRVGPTATVWASSERVDDSGVGVDGQAWQAGLEICVALVQRSAWVLDACGAGQTGVLTVSGVGYGRPQSESPVFWSATTELALRFARWGPVRVGLALGAIIPIGRYRFYGDTPTGVCRARHRRTM